MNYTIIIDENQREILRQVLAHSVIINPDLADEREILRDMFADLPNEEAKNPGCMHGFCY